MKNEEKTIQEHLEDCFDGKHEFEIKINIGFGGVYKECIHCGQKLLGKLN